MNLVKKVAFVALIAAGFFSYGLIVGHYQIAPFNSIRALKQRVTFEIVPGDWKGLHVPGLAPRESRAPVEIAMLGDSITARADWAGMFPRSRIVNLGIDGDTSAGVLNRLEDVVSLRPRVVFLMVGVNDLRRKFPIELVETHIRLAAERLSEHGITPVIQSTLYVSSEKLNEQIEALNAMTRVWCAAKSIVYIDLNEVLSPQGVLLPRFTEDGVHLNEDAYHLWADVIRRHVGFGLHPVE